MRASKVVYLGMSDIPAWQVSRMQAIADQRARLDVASAIELGFPHSFASLTASWRGR
ncbi:hypothetical protein SAMN05216304_103184 [Bosea sp. OK403]|uniref:hypothetical protein n=1 Tax=Bosea sp. OK403 TaxID=1855286 RepID=UPI0008DFE829|nr:hypothetical protein [Bosea sp. OK403]SFI69150.1 hypothetical protein SAMN05216304_103184 [Bosea sp. OK403]